MKIIEAMKELRLIEKKIDKNKNSITKYAAQASNERLYFDTRTAQEKEVKSLIQANKDLADRYIALKTAIERTNLETSIDFMGKSYSLSELLIYKRKVARFMIDTYSSLNDAQAKMGMRGGLSMTGENLTVERFYTEQFKNENSREWSDFYESIDARLEVVNATTDVVGI